MFVKIVDDQGEEIGCIDRNYLVKLGLRHQIARVLIFSKQTEEVLLQQRSKSAKSCPGMWDTSSSGHVDSHESAKDAALRELDEEIGVKSTGSIDRVGTINTKEELNRGILNRETLLYCLIVDSPADIKPIINHTEVECVKWVKLANSDKKNGITPGAKKCLLLLQSWLKEHKNTNKP